MLIIGRTVRDDPGRRAHRCSWRRGTAKRSSARDPSCLIDSKWFIFICRSSAPPAFPAHRGGHQNARMNCRSEEYFETQIEGSSSSIYDDHQFVLPHANLSFNANLINTRFANLNEYILYIKIKGMLGLFSRSDIKNIFLKPRLSIYQSELLWILNDAMKWYIEIIFDALKKKKILTAYVCRSHNSENFPEDHFLLGFLEIRSDLEPISTAPGDPSEGEGCEKGAARTLVNDPTAWARKSSMLPSC